MWKNLFLPFVASADWDYSQNGADWPDGFLNCGSINQSPINLVTPDSEEFDYEIYKARDDAYTKSYANPVDANVNFNGHTSQVDLDTEDGRTMFNSKLAGEVFGAETEFKAV